MAEMLMSVSCAVLPDRGEDSFVLGQDAAGGYLCVADGCGGLGSKRYEQLGGRTGACAAARLAVRAFSRWVQDHPLMPLLPQTGGQLCEDLGKTLHHMFAEFARKYCQEEKTRIQGSMQRTLPTTLCAAYVQENRQTDLCFAWAGDSRGYVLDAGGLHQCTKDHLRPELDAFESLYRDVPLARLICADVQPQLSMRRMHIHRPCVVITATDGAYSSLLTPMEFEFLLLDTLQSAKNWTSWEKKLTNRLKKMAQDDATLLLKPCGFDTFETLQETLLPRRAEVQKAFVTPVRRHRKDVEYARRKWLEYRKDYDWTEGGRHERMDWRI